MDKRSDLQGYVILALGILAVVIVLIAVVKPITAGIEHVKHVVTYNQEHRSTP